MAYNDFKRYVWLISQLKCSEEEYGGMTFKQIDEAWQDCPLNPVPDEPLPRRTFHNHIAAIREIFGIDIVLKDRRDGKYSISYLEDGEAKRRQGDLTAMLSLNEMADRLKGMKGRILYEEPPLVWPGWLSSMVQAMKDGRKIVLKYRKYGEDTVSERILSPYCLKLFKRRWYLVAKEGKEIKTFALDRRTRGVGITKENFRMPKAFDPAEYFQDTYGITRSAPQKVLVKTFGRETEFWRSTPLHSSQREIATGDDFAIFELYVGTEGWEFIQELLSRGYRIEVVEPRSLRERMAAEIRKMGGRYAEFWQDVAEDSDDSSYIGDSKMYDMDNTSIPNWDTQAAKEKGAKGSFARKAVRANVFKNNNEIFAAGRYLTDGGSVIQLPGPDDPMLTGTIVYSERFRVGGGPIAASGTETAVENSDCILVARRMLERGLNPAVLNLADCHVACGFYPGGSNAQEESLCRSTTLSRSLYQYYDEKRATQVSVPFRGKRYPMDYHFGGIYSPGVTVFRDAADNFRLLEEPFKLGIISVAALNFREKDDHKERDLKYRSQDGGFTAEGLQIMQDKIRTIYRIALVNGHDSLVLGAFGCGAFRLRADLVARLFHDILEEDEFFGRFREIRFAILERGRAAETGLNGKFAPFYRLFDNEK